MRMTFTMAPMAETMHMSTVSTNINAANCGVMMIGNAEPEVCRIMMSPVAVAMPKAVRALDMRAVGHSYKEISRFAGGYACIEARAIERREHVGRGGERADAFREREHFHFAFPDFCRGAKPVYAQPAEIGLIHRNRSRDF